MSNAIWIRKLFNAVLLLGTILVLMWSLREKNFFAEQFLQFINLALGFRRQCYTSAKHSLLSRLVENIHRGRWWKFSLKANVFAFLDIFLWFMFNVYVLYIVWRWRNFIAAISQITQNELANIFFINNFHMKLVQ